MLNYYIYYTVSLNWAETKQKALQEFRRVKQQQTENEGKKKKELKIFI